MFVGSCMDFFRSYSTCYDGSWNLLAFVSKRSLSTQTEDQDCQFKKKEEKEKKQKKTKLYK